MSQLETAIMELTAYIIIVLLCVADCLDSRAFKHVSLRLKIKTFPHSFNTTPPPHHTFKYQLLPLFIRGAYTYFIEQRVSERHIILNVELMIKCLGACMAAIPIRLIRSCSLCRIDKI